MAIQALNTAFFYTWHRAVSRRRGRSNSRPKPPKNRPVYCAHDDAQIPSLWRAFWWIGALIPRCTCAGASSDAAGANVGAGAAGNTRAYVEGRFDDAVALTAKDQFDRNWWLLNAKGADRARQIQGMPRTCCVPSSSVSR